MTGGEGGLLTFFLAGSMRDKGLLTFAAILKFLFYRATGREVGEYVAAVSIFVKKGVGSLVYSCTLVYSIDFSKEKLRNELTVNYNTIHFCFYIKIG